MTRRWIAVALLAGSWLFGLGYFQPVNLVAWIGLLGVSVILLAGSPVAWPSRSRMTATLAMLLPAALLLPTPGKAAVFLFCILCFLAVGLGIDYYALQKRYRALDQNITAVFKQTFPGVKRIVDPVQQMKVKISSGDRTQRAATINSLCETLGAELVQSIGHIALIYRVPED